MPRPLIAIVGDTHLARGGRKRRLAVILGRRLIDEGYRIVTGGIGDLPLAVAQGARSSTKYRDGDLIAILPGFEPKDAKGCADIVIATGLDHARNMIVANCDAVVAVGGGAGTLSEIALAWSLRRLVIGVQTAGWSGRLAGTRVDERKRQIGIKQDQVYAARTADDVVTILRSKLSQYRRRHRGIRLKS